MAPSLPSPKNSHTGPASEYWQLEPWMARINLEWAKLNGTWLSTENHYILCCLFARAKSTWFISNVRFSWMIFGTWAGKQTTQSWNICSSPVAEFHKFNDSTWGILKRQSQSDLHNMYVVIDIIYIYNTYIHTYIHTYITLHYIHTYILTLHYITLHTYIHYIHTYIHIIYIYIKGGFLKWGHPCSSSIL